MPLDRSGLLRSAIRDSHAAITGCGMIERMPNWLICIPRAVQWAWLSLRYRSFTLPSAANPSIPSGGLVGEGKMDYFKGMGPLARQFTARSWAISTACAPTGESLALQMRAAGLGFPVIAKPDLGLCGFGVQRVDDLHHLLAYALAFPRDEVIVLQEYLYDEGEAGIFYARDPRTDRAELIGMALRYYPRVTGDGRRSLDALIKADARTRRSQGGRHVGNFDGALIPPAGHVVRLATIGSTRVGGLYRDGASWISPALCATIDAIARDMPDFYCGRFDVRFSDINALQAGDGFKIIEINGAGSEAIQAWDPDVPLWKAFQIIFAKQRRLFAIGAAMRERGVRPIGLRELARLYRRQLRLIDLYPPSN